MKLKKLEFLTKEDSIEFGRIFSQFKALKYLACECESSPHFEKYYHSFQKSLSSISDLKLLKLVDLPYNVYFTFNEDSISHSLQELEIEYVDYVDSPKITKDSTEKPLMNLLKVTLAGLHRLRKLKLNLNTLRDEDYLGDSITSLVNIVKY